MLLKADYAKTVARLVSWLNARLTSRSHNSVNFHPILKIKVSKFKLQFYLFNNVSFTDIYVYIYSKLSYRRLKLFPFFWDILYVSELYRTIYHGCNTCLLRYKQHLPYQSSSHGQETISFLGPKLWNNLPVAIKSGTNVNILSR